MSNCFLEKNCKKKKNQKVEKTENRKNRKSEHQYKILHIQNTSSSLVRSSNIFSKNINKHSITSVKWGQ